MIVSRQTFRIGKEPIAAYERIIIIRGRSGENTHFSAGKVLKPDTCVRYSLQYSTEQYSLLRIGDKCLLIRDIPEFIIKKLKILYKACLVLQLSIRRIIVK